ncbi:polysaccharide biosynthesis protein [Gammaproteobacteria bacterium]|jgi:UDP-N-acetylglucosamine 4,6-dehydratase/5-epimerase|nr:polysaccharide biosynthesis protein [Gammaproteobacteria bacterium]
MFKNKTLLITGGTGSFGNAIVNRFLNSDISEIRILSRDEKKQDDMRKKFSNAKLKFYIGDVRNKDSISEAISGVDFIFHAAALKQVPSCEFFPLQALETNALGTENVLDVAIQQKVSKVICLSTDKAVYPINAMGMTKAIMEKIAVAKSRNSKNTDICITRYGNVMASRGSVIPLFLEQIEKNTPLTITNPEMTRFMMTLDHAVDLVIYAFKNGENGDTYVQKAPSASISLVASTLLKLYKSNCGSQIIGNRHGEKMYEVLCSKEEMMTSQDLGDYIRIPADVRDLNYDKYNITGTDSSVAPSEYHSSNTQALDEKSLIKLLSSINIVGIE